MKDITPDRIKNIGLFGHSGCGKTSFGEAILYLTGENTRLGRTDDGTSILDYDEDEIERKTSINLSLGYGIYKDTFFNIIDTPGYADFTGDLLCGVWACDTGVIIIDATSGIEFGTELVSQYLSNADKAKVIFVNKLKKEHTDFYKIVGELKGFFKGKICPINLPMGKGEDFSGIVSLLTDKAFAYKGGKREEVAIPKEMESEIAEYRDLLTEVMADIDDSLMEKYLEGKEITPEEIKRALKRGIESKRIIPVLCGDAYFNIGIEEFLEFAAEYLPSSLEIEIKGKNPKTEAEEKKRPEPEGPLIALTFKTVADPHIGDLIYTRVFSGRLEPGMTVYNVSVDSQERINQIYRIKGKERREVNSLNTGEIGGLVKLKKTKTSHTLAHSSSPLLLPTIPFPDPSISIAIVPKTKGDEERVSNGLARLHSEDPTFAYHYDTELKQQLVSGLGELHLDVILGKLKKKFGVDVEVQRPKIPYRETIKGRAEAQGKYKKQTGGHGQYGDVWLRLEPLPRGKGFEFGNEIFGGVVPSKYIPSVEKGVRETMAQGVLAGFPVIDLKVTLYDGSYHPVDSSDIAFKIAASIGFKAAAEKAGLTLLEPIYEVEVTVPETYMGDVIGDINSRRGKIQGMEPSGGFQKIKALVPLAEMYKYSTTLRSMTQGRGYFKMRFSHYEEVPKEIASKIIEEAKRERNK